MGWRVSGGRQEEGNGVLVCWRVRMLAGQPGEERREDGTPLARLGMFIHPPSRPTLGAVIGDSSLCGQESALSAGHVIHHTGSVL